MAANLEQELLSKARECLKQNNRAEAEIHLRAALQHSKSQEGLFGEDTAKYMAKLQKSLETGDYSLLIQSMNNSIFHNNNIFQADFTQPAQLSFEPAAPSAEDSEEGLEQQEELGQQRENKNGPKCCRIM